MNKILKYLTVLFIPFCITWTSCDDDFPQNIESDGSDKTVIQSIKIMNAGADGTLVLDGTVDEIKKEINFPKIDTLTNLSAIKFEAVLSNGAILEKDTYDFNVEEGQTEKTELIRVLNGTRYRDYFIKIRLKLPVWGADFSEDAAKIYDFSATAGTDKMLSEFTAVDGRQASMNLNNIFIVHRKAPVLINIAALKEGKVERKALDITGLTGWMGINGGLMAHGHLYTANMATGVINVGHWLESAPDIKPTITSHTGVNSLPGFTSRFDGFMSHDINKDGNGNIYIHNNSSTPSILKLSVTNFTEIGYPSIMVTAGVKDHPGTWSAFNKAPSTDEYIYTGFRGPVMLASADGNVLYTVPTTTLPAENSGNAKVIEFNNERYLAVITSAGASVIVYNITRGGSLLEALSLLDTKAPLFSYSLGGGVPSANASISIDWVKDGDETLYLMGAAPEAGLVLFEFPKNVDEEEE